VPTTGEPVVVRNKPWFASIASLQFEAGERYVVQVSGSNIRPISLAIRDPSGKFSSSLSPWQWSEVDGQQRAITSVTANRPGRWALELRPAANSVRDVTVSVAKVGSGGSYEGVITVDETLQVGDATDVQLGPNEFAALTVKLNDATPQIIQPEVLRYRNKTFQPTAVDMSVWDSKGRLVWSNNRNLEEEVLSGRLGKEPSLSERFATVASAEPYLLIIDPHTDLAGRFRVSVASTPVVSDVALGSGKIPVLLGGTKTGVVEVREPTRYRITGASACIASTSLSEWNGQNRCILSGRTISLPPGVHRLTFNSPVTGTASFEKVAAGSPPDPIDVIETSIGGTPARISSGAGEVLVRFNVPAAGTRFVMSTDKNLSGGVLVRPDGIRESTYGVYVAPIAGTYQLWTLRGSSGRDIAILPAVSEVQPAALAFGAKPKFFRLTWGQRLEATVTLKKKTSMYIDVFVDDTVNRGDQFSFLYAADKSERRYGGVDFQNYFTLPAGTYRFVFVGNGFGRITLKKSPPKDPFIEG
jgi:hypothetical protein